MSIEFKVAGITFAVEANPDLAQAKPEGGVSFERELDNPYDSDAIRVMWNGMKLGYIGRNDPARQTVRALLESGEEIDASVKDYAYKDPDGFNEVHSGKLQAVNVLIENDVQKYDDVRKRDDYVRITTLLEDYWPGGLDWYARWLYSLGVEYKDYEKEMERRCTKGNNLHRRLENALRDGAIDSLNINEWNFLNDHEIEFIDAEKAVYDDIGVRGTYDCLAFVDGVKTILDWKSGKAVKKTHRTQVGFYGHNAGAEQAWVIAFGAKNKRGYSLSKVDIEKEYQKVKLLKQLRDLG